MKKKRRVGDEMSESPNDHDGDKTMMKTDDRYFFFTHCEESTRDKRASRRDRIRRADEIEMKGDVFLANWDERERSETERHHAECFGRCLCGYTRGSEVHEKLSDICITISRYRC